MSQRAFFEAQKAAGDAGERLLDEFFARLYTIVPASVDDQRREIDRWFSNRNTGHRFPVEYKADERAGQTGNAFVETESNVERGTKGWVYVSEAEYLIYLVTAWETIYCVPFADLRHALPRWLSQYPVREVANPKYTTRGVLVPLHELERCASRTFKPSKRSS